MRIQRLHIENFGKLHNFDLELQSGWNVIYAENGWGKSTLAAFIKAMFYGLDYTTKRSLKDNERKKYMPWQGGPFGGNLEFWADEKLYRVERSFGAKEKEDTFVIYDRNTGLKSDSYSERLGEELFHLDRAAFERTSFFAQMDFSVSINDSLNSGLTRVESDAGDMQNYDKAIASLEGQMKYYQKTGNRGQIEKLKEERRKVQEILSDCRYKENAAVSWKARIAEKEHNKQELLEDIHTLEDQIQEIRTYEALAAKKEQYDLLKNQALETEEKFRQTAAALAEFTHAPAKEEELDRCRETLYRLKTLRMQKDDIKEQIRQEKEKLKHLRNTEKEHSKQSSSLWILIVLLCVIVAAAMMKGWLIVGLIILLPALGIAFMEIQKYTKQKAQVDAYQEKLDSGKERLQEKKDVYQALNEKCNQIEESVCRFLDIQKGLDFAEMEECWKQERQQSRKYIMIKQEYESRRKEANQSRETYLKFQKTCSQEELAKLITLQEPRWELEELQEKLYNCQLQRETLIKEQRDLHNQVRLLEEKAELIPELEAEEEHLTQELESAIHEHHILETTLKYLKEAKDQFSTRYLKELQQGLEHYVALLEPERKADVSLDIKLNLKVQEAGALRPLAHFSFGWQDLFHLAERLSILDALYKEEQPLLLLDDPFVNLDERKQKQAMKLLKEQSEKRQMIFFTCHPTQD